MRNGPSNPLRLLMHVPVPWVFVLTYLVGVVAEYTWPPSIVVGNTLPGLQIAGGVLLAVVSFFETPIILEDLVIMSIGM